jgi:peptide/nickel transport system substrate-binding protein
MQGRTWSRGGRGQREASGIRARRGLSRRELLLTALGAGGSASLLRSLAGRDLAWAQGDAPQPGGELVYASSSRFDTLDPNVTTFTDVARIGFHLFDPLVWEVKAGEYVPGLAEKWEVSPTADRYTFHLRKDVKFHDGTPFTADAVKFTFDRIVDPELKSQMAFSALGPYESSTVVNPQTIVVKFKRPFAPFMSSAAQSVLAPVSPDAARKLGKDFGTRPVGTGPFRLDTYTTDSVVRMVRNPDYRWGPSLFKQTGPPYLDAISWRIIPEASTRLASLRAGEVHVIQDVPAQEYRNVQREAAIQLLQGELAGSGFSMMMNVTRPPTDDVRVRQALEWGVDRAAVVRAVWQGVPKAACSPLTSVMLGYDPATCNVYRYDPKKAGDLLDEAGWKMGPNGVRRKDGQDLTLALYYRSDNADFTAMATFLQGMYQPIGITVELNGLAQAGYFNAVRAGQHNLQFWWDSRTDPDVVRILLHSANANGGTNRNRYKNAEMDALIDEAAGTSDVAKRKRLYTQIQMKTLQEAVMVFFADPLNVFAYQKAKVMGAMLDWSATNVLLHNAWLRR